MAQGNTSKTSKQLDEITHRWEVTGEFEFTPDGKLLNIVKTVLFVNAFSASDAARKAIERMGANATIKRTEQLFETKEEDNE